MNVDSGKIVSAVQGVSMVGFRGICGITVVSAWNGAERRNVFFCRLASLARRFLAELEVRVGYCR